MTVGLFLITIFQHKVQQNVRKITNNKGIFKTINVFQVHGENPVVTSKTFGNMNIYSVKHIYCASVNKLILYL